MQVRWFGQSAFALGAGDDSVFIDPFGDMEAARGRGVTWNYPEIKDAVADLNLVLATTARPREAVLPVMDARQGAAQLRAASVAGEKCGILFGGERAGLEANDIALCHGVVTAPVDDRHRSLNLAQSVAIVAYEWRMSASPAPPAGFADAPAAASHAAFMGLCEQLEVELDAAGFFHPLEKRPSMIRNLRVALGRARLTDQEVRTMRGVVTALSKGRGKVLEKLAAKTRALDKPGAAKP